MGTSAVADREAMLAALAQMETLQAQMNSLSIDAFTPLELLDLQQRRETLAWLQPVLDYKVYQRLRAECTPKELGGSSYTKVLAARLRISEAEAFRRLKNAELLGPRTALTGEPMPPALPNVAAAQAKGQIGPEHVSEIKSFFRTLPQSVDFQAREAAETDLARHASTLGADGFTAVADRLKYLLDQDGTFTDTDRQARRGLRLGKQRPDGTVPFSGYLTPEAAATWEAVKAKLAAPGMCNPADEHPCYSGTPTQAQIDNDTRTLAQRQHDAFVAVGRSVLASGALGQHNGLPTTIIVRTTLQDLEARAGVGVTGGGTVLPISEVIRMAAHATHYLAVFDKATGSAMDLFRARRTASAAQRIMLIARDGGCTKPGCTVPAYGTQVHHAARDWADNGQTNVDDMGLACPPDNRMVEPGGWSTRINDENDVEWIPPPHLDTGQARINTYHRPEQLLQPPDDEQPRRADTHESGRSDVDESGPDVHQPSQPETHEFPWPETHLPGRSDTHEPGGPEPNAA